MSPDALLNTATEWAVSRPRRLAFIIAALILAGAPAAEFIAAQISGWLS